MTLSHLQPQAFFKHFEAISQIPRGSGNEKAVSDYVAGFARGLGYKAVQDDLHNVIIYKPAGPGYENKPAVILQGHLDMVCEKNAGTAHDFMKDPLKLRVDGDFVTAEGTTLGADNGTAVAMCMALLEDKTLAHPALEMVLTTEEETGMGGAEGLDAGLLSGTRMINLDSGDENTIVIGCAAGVTVEYRLPGLHGRADSAEIDQPVLWEAVPANTAAFTLTVKGLKGGHSGADINKGRGNALVILGKLLAALRKEFELHVARASGGMKLNAIPREAEAVVTVPQGQEENVTARVAELAREFSDMFRAAEPGLVIACEKAEQPERVFAPGCLSGLISSLLLLPNGVQAMCQDMPDVVAASCNVGVLETTENGVMISCFPRGATVPYLKGMEAQINALASLTGAEARFIQRSPAWAYNPDSPLLKTVVECFTRQNGKPPTVTALHAGLECGILAEKLPGLDIVSLGPNTFDLHTPDERLSISSTQRVWQFLLSLLEAL